MKGLGEAVKKADGNASKVSSTNAMAKLKTTGENVD